MGKILPSIFFIAVNEIIENRVISLDLSQQR